MKNEKKHSDIIAIRDAGLRARIIALVELAKKSGRKLAIADILRSALYEKLDRMEQSGKFSISIGGETGGVAEDPAPYDAKPKRAGTPPPQSPRRSRRRRS